MNSSQLIGHYLTTRRANGARLESAERLLYQFARETGDLPLADVTSQAVSVFLCGRGELSATWKTRRAAVLRGLYRFAMARGHVQTSPLPDQCPKLPPQITPYVYSRDELQRLLDATGWFATRTNRLQGLTYRSLLLLLYATGLRVSEALRLRLADMDWEQRMLTVRESNFYKTRLVPIGEDAFQVLSRYVDRRCRELPMPLGVSSALFASRSGRPLSYRRVLTVFHTVRAEAGIGCPPGESYKCRDLREAADALSRC